MSDPKIGCLVDVEKGLVDLVRAEDLDDKKMIFDCLYIMTLKGFF